MKNKFGKILIGVGAILFLLFVVFILFGDRILPQAPVTDVDRDVPPFGTVDNRDPNTGVAVDTTDTVEDPDILPDETDTTPTKGVLPDLFQITDFAVTDTYAYTTPRESLETVTKTITQELPNGDVQLVDTAEDILITRDIPHVRYNKRANGYIYDTEIVYGLPRTQRTKDTVLDAEELVFGTKGETVGYQFWNTQTEAIQTFEGSLIPQDTLLSCPYPLDTTLRLGDIGIPVEDLQVIFDTSDLPYDRSELLPGTFNEALENIVKRLQRLYGMKDDGIVGVKTREAFYTLCIDQQKKIFEAESNGAEETHVLSGIFREQNIIAYVRAPNTDDVFYLVKQQNGVVGYLSTLTGDTHTQIFSFPFTEWIIDWVNNNLITFTTKASQSVPGHMYFYNIKNRTMTRVLGNIPGLTTNTNNTGTRTLYSQSTQDGFQTFLYNHITNTTTLLSIATLSEKCSWSSTNERLLCGVPKVIPTGIYPDDWYKGKVGFDDTLTILQVENGISTPIENLSTTDITKPNLVLDETLLLFLDKQTGYLWGRKLGDL